MMKMHRRMLLALAGLAVAGAAQAADETPPPVVGAPKILEALNPKDVVLDNPGAPGSRPPRRDPAISLQVQFGFDSAELMPQGKRQLDELAMALNDKALAVSGFELGGHTDKVGDAAYNVRLSMDRANAVRAYLIEVHGIAAQRLQAIGFGYARLADPSRPTAAVNRRVEVRRVSGMRPAPAANRPANAAPATSPSDRLVPTPR